MPSAGRWIGFWAWVFAGGHDQGKVGHTGSGFFQQVVNGGLQFANRLVEFDRILRQFYDRVAQVNDPLFGG